MLEGTVSNVTNWSFVDIESIRTDWFASSFNRFVKDLAKLYMGAVVKVKALASTPP